MFIQNIGLRYRLILGGVVVVCLDIKALIIIIIIIVIIIIIKIIIIIIIIIITMMMMMMMMIGLDIEPSGNKGIKALEYT